MLTVCLSGRLSAVQDVFSVRKQSPEAQVRAATCERINLRPVATITSASGFLGNNRTMLCIFKCCMCSALRMSYCWIVVSAESLKPLIRVNVLRVSDALDVILRSSGAATHCNHVKLQTIMFGTLFTFASFFLLCFLQ